MSEKKTYVTTERAGFVVAGHRIPPTYELDEEVGKSHAKPTVGHKLELTADEAQYELAQGTIALAPSEAAPAEEEKKSPEPDAGDAA